MIAILCIALIGFTAAAQLLLKVGALKASRLGAINKYVLWAYTLFLATVTFSYFLMQNIEMKYFAALMSANYIMVAAGSALILKEKISGRGWIATLMIASGVIIFVLN